MRHLKKHVNVTSRLLLLFTFRVYLGCNESIEKFSPVRPLHVSTKGSLVEVVKYLD